VKERTERYKYSYHYQDGNGKVIFRYDMAPHHIEIETFPHHKHINSEKVIEIFKDIPLHWYDSDKNLRHLLE